MAASYLEILYEWNSLLLSAAANRGLRILTKVEWLDELGTVAGRSPVRYYLAQMHYSLNKFDRGSEMPMENNFN